MHGRYHRLETPVRKGARVQNKAREPVDEGGGRN